MGTLAVLLRRPIDSWDIHAGKTLRGPGMQPPHLSDEEKENKREREMRFVS